MAFTQSYETFQAHSIVKVLWFRNEPCQNFQLLQIDVQNNQDGFVRYSKTTPVPTTDEINLTSILALYDIVTTIYIPIRDKVIRNRMSKLKIRRPSDEILDSIYEQQVTYWLLLRQFIPEYNELFSSRPQDKVARKYRTDEGGHLMFRPIGQKAFAKALRVLMDRGWTMEKGVDALANIPMELSEAPWEHVLWVPGTKRINTKVNSLLPENICLYYIGQETSKPNYNVLKEYRKVVDNPNAFLRQKK